MSERRKGGTSKENSTATLTAYVILSLLEANIDVPKQVQTNIKYCIRSQHNPDKYYLAIICYALFKLNWNTEANRFLKRLIAVSEQQENLLWWTNKDNSTATDIEITSYVLLSLLHESSTENLAYAQSVVRWLTAKFGPKGGFKSTQDTVVALDALSRFAKIVKSRSLHINVHVEAGRHKQNFTLQSNDPLKSKAISVHDESTDVNIAVRGEGCVLAQVIHTYYLRHIMKSEAFKLAIDVAPVSTIDQCSIASLSPCLAYTGPDGPANMAVMEVNLPSGYQADRASLYSLIESDSTSKIKMFEEEDNKVNIYFTKVDKQLMCFSFNINENTEIEGRKDSVVKVFDYYRPEYNILQFYTLSSSCYNRSDLLDRNFETQITINNIPISLSESNNDSKNVTKRDTSSTPQLEQIISDKCIKVKVKDDATMNEKLNPEFVIMNNDMETPKGMEANMPTYIKPTSDELKNMTT
ncbi:unnamed protein product [Acanthoscelides obtectus]|uniref:Alpha-macroglobulin receptor-binding domain-containing protein n=1 Tax=Acanthoscelides obtectus TaxID=200917 RepID=A0A9P0LIA6_ACAOB|nr:unnamed protein product [Acanthoscelides obtectus]CAK1663574.1 Murinoglobulin-1 [Acanthoscelides obtectus]